VGHRLRPGSSPKLIAETLDPSVEDEAFLYAYTAYIDVFTNSDRFLLLALRLLNFSERRGYRLGIVMSSNQIGTALDFLALFKLATWYRRSGMDAAGTLQQPYALGHAYSGWQVHEFYTGELAQSLVHGRSSAQSYHEAGDLVAWAFPTSILASGSIHRGEFAEALALCKELIRVGQDSGAPALLCWGKSALGYVLRRQGQLGEAIECQQKALELAEAIPDYIYQITSRADLGLCYLRQGNWQAALSELETCWHFVVKHHVIEPFSRTTMFNNLAETYLFAVESGGTSEKAVWLNKAKHACQAAIKASSACQFKTPETMRVHGSYEWLRGKHALAQKWWQKGLAGAERMGLRYDLGMIHLEMGQRLGERRHLEEAEIIFTDIGAEWDLAKARKLLR